MIDVVLIGGPPGAGKTTLGRSLATAIGFSSLTADDLVLACRMVTTRSTHPALHLMNNGSTDYFTNNDSTRLIANAKSVAETMWPAVERVITRHARSRSSMVVDWWLLSPPLVAGMNLPNLASIWLHMDPDALRARERSNTDFFGPADGTGQMLANFMERSLWRNSLVAREAEAHGLPVLRLRGDEPPATVTELAMDLLGLSG